MWKRIVICLEFEMVSTWVGTIVTRYISLIRSFCLLLSTAFMCLLTHGFLDNGFLFSFLVYMVYMALLRTRAGAWIMDYVDHISFWCFVLLESVICLLSFALYEKPFVWFLGSRSASSQRRQRGTNWLFKSHLILAGFTFGICDVFTDN